MLMVLDFFFFLINPNPIPVITANITANCDPNSLDSLTLDAGPGWASYVWYTWSYSATDQTLSPHYLHSFTYDVSVTDGNGCGGTASEVITLYPTPYLSIAQSGFNCQDTTVHLTVTDYYSIGHNTYVWSNGSTDSAISVIALGTYTVTVTSEFGCINTASTNVTVTLPHPQMYSTASTTFCQGSNDLIYADHFTGYSSYLWSDSSTLWYDYADTSGIYSVTVTDVNGCTGVTSIVITENPNPIPVITANITANCDPNSLDSLTLDAGPGWASYVWYTWSYSATDQTLSPHYLHSFTYDVSVTDGNGCGGTASEVITLYPTPYLSIAQSGFNCQDTTVHLTVTDYYSIGHNTYVWSNGSTDSAISVI